MRMLVKGESGRSFSKRLSELLEECDKYFEEFRNQPDEDASKKLLKHAPSSSRSKPDNSRESRIFNVIRIPRVKPSSASEQSASFVPSLTAVPTQTVIDSTGRRQVVSDTRFPMFLNYFCLTLRIQAILNKLFSYIF